MLNSSDVRAALSSGSSRMALEVSAGLRLSPKRVPSKYFYDARGSALFERICEQPEYYLTRVELALMSWAFANTGTVSEVSCVSNPWNAFSSS